MTVISDIFYKNIAFDQHYIKLRGKNETKK